MTRKKSEESLEDFYERYFGSMAFGSETYDEDEEEELDHSEDEETYIKESLPPLDTMHSDEDSVSSDWDGILSQCTQGYQEEEIARNSVIRAIDEDDRVSLIEYNIRKIEALCDKHEIPEGVYYLSEMYQDRKNISRGLREVDCMISNSEFSDEEILLLFEVRMLWYQLPHQHISWNTLAQLLQSSHGIPSREEFMTTLEIVLEKQTYNRFLDIEQLVRNFSDLINTNMYY